MHIVLVSIQDMTVTSDAFYAISGLKSLSQTHELSNTNTICQSIEPLQLVPIQKRQQTLTFKLPHLRKKKKKKEEKRHL